VILNNYTMKASLQQPLFTGWRLQSAADNAEYISNAAHSDYTKDKAELVYSIKSAYWNVYRAKELKRLSDENVIQIGQHLADIENLFRQGMATTNAVLKVKVQLSNAKLLQSDASNNVEIAIIAFNSTIGIPLDTDVGIASSLTPTTKDFPEVQQMLVKAMNERPDMHAMEWRLRASQAGITAAQSGWLPQVFLSGNYYYSRPNQRIFPAQDQFKDTWDLGVNLQFDIWNNLTTVYQTAQAQSQYEQAKDAFAMLKDGVTLEVTQNYLNVRQVKQKIQLAQLGVEQSDENLRVAQETFKAGLTTNSELLDAEVGQLQSKIQLLQALVEYELAQAKLEKSVGVVE
jgi:outer membrane protein TolC